MLNEEDLPNGDTCMEEVEDDLNHMLGVHDKNFTYSLFAYPAEDNFAGVKYPLSWIKKVQDGYFQDVGERESGLVSGLICRDISGWFCWMLLRIFLPTDWISPL